VYTCKNCQKAFGGWEIDVLAVIEDTVCWWPTAKKITGAKGALNFVSMEKKKKVNGLIYRKLTAGGPGHWDRGAGTSGKKQEEKSTRPKQKQGARGEARKRRRAAMKSSRKSTFRLKRSILSQGGS